MGKKASKEQKPRVSRKEYPEVMNIAQVAEYLQLHKQVVYRHVKAGNIPVSRIGATIRFKKSVIDAWLVDSARKSLRKGIVPEPGPSFARAFNPEED